MARRRSLAAIVTAALLGTAAATAATLAPRQSNGSTSCSGAGQVAVIQKWDIQSTAKITTDPAQLAQTGVSTASWIHANVSRCTLMACLINAGLYKDSDLFMSNNLEAVDTNQFRVPWLYRAEFPLKPAAGQHFFLRTNGITSKADLYINGKQVADKTVQSGAYGGHSYEITSLVKEGNALVARVYPTDYMLDFGVGFVDWNPTPPDNGTGIWREVSVKQTGSVALGPLRVATTFDKPIGQGSATVALKATVQNLENRTVTVDAEGVISRDNACGSKGLTKSLTLAPGASSELSIELTLNNPAIWWPKQWGAQPLYQGRLSVSVNNATSDMEMRTFGIRQVTHQINAYNDSIYSVNGRPFQVLGAGYASDMFLRWDTARWTSQAQYVLEMGMNTVRLEGKLEQPEFYDVADRLGLMIMPGWECCDKWEAWSYNDNIPPPIPVWSANDYATANASIHHEAAELQPHPSVLTFLVGSDFWPSDEAAAMYVNTLKAFNWETPIIPYAAKKDGYPKILTPPSFKMDGPYDWVPPNYWWDTQPAADRLGAAFGFGSELGPGVGTPELASLKKFLSQADQDDLWKAPNKSMLHMTMASSDFATRTIYNLGLYHRYGTPTSLDDYLLKAQIADYEATRAEYEAYASMWSATRPATGAIYWMLNGAWPSLHWALFDYYLKPAGAYFGVKVGGRLEHAAFDPVHKALYVVNRRLNATGARAVAVDVVDLTGKTLSSTSVPVPTSAADSSRRVADLSVALRGVADVAFLRLVLSDTATNNTLSRNVYWLPRTNDVLDWDNSSWYHTPVSRFADMSALMRMSPATVTATLAPATTGTGWTISLENKAAVPAFFIKLALVNAAGDMVAPVFWSDNYVTLLPHEKIELQVKGTGGVRIEVSGSNVEKTTVAVSVV